MSIWRKNKDGTFTYLGDQGDVLFGIYDRLTKEQVEEIIGVGALEILKEDGEEECEDIKPGGE